MITEKTHEFLTAYFTNNEKTSATAEWREKSSGRIMLEAMICKDGEYEWERLKTILTEDELHEHSYRKYKSDREAFELDIMYIAQREGFIDEIIEDAEKLYTKFAELFIMPQDEIDAEKIFRFKLKLFEHELVEKSDDREKKAALRKAKTYKEVLLAYSAFCE